MRGHPYRICIPWVQWEWGLGIIVGWARIPTNTYTFRLAFLGASWCDAMRCDSAFSIGFEYLFCVVPPAVDPLGDALLQGWLGWPEMDIISRCGPMWCYPMRFYSNLSTCKRCDEIRFDFISLPMRFHFRKCVYDAMQCDSICTHWAPMRCDAIPAQTINDFWR